MEFSEKLRCAMELSGVSGRELARRLGVHYNTVCSWIAGRSTPPAFAQPFVLSRLGHPMQEGTDGTYIIHTHRNPYGGGEMFYHELYTFAAGKTSVKSLPDITALAVAVSQIEADGFVENKQPGGLIP